MHKDELSVKHQIRILKISKDIPVNLLIEQIFFEDIDIRYDDRQKKRLQGLVTAFADAFNVKGFKYYISNSKVIFHSINMNTSEKKADSAECKFANMAVHDTNYFETALLDPKILAAIHNGSLRLDNLVNAMVREFCLEKQLTPHDLCGVDFLLDVYLMNHHLKALLYIDRLTLKVLQGIRPTEREKLRAIGTDQVVFDHLADGSLSIEDMLKLNIQKSTKPSDVLKEIAKIQATQPVKLEENLMAARNDSCKCSLV
jgi:hypothetical protein